MNPETIIAQLEQINAWRRGEESEPQPDPKHVGEVIDAAVASLRSLIASNTTLRSEARAELKQRKADVTRMEECLRNSGRNMDEAQEQIAERDARVADLSDALARVTAERDAAKAEALGNAASYRDADARRAENYRMLTTVQGERDVAKRDIVALRARVAEVEVQAERYRLATLRQDADLARVTAERDHWIALYKERNKTAAILEDTSIALRARVAELDESLHLANGTADLALHHRDIAEQRNAELEAALDDLLGCPTVTDRATCPDGDPSRINEAPEWQAVLQISCAWTRYKKLKALARAADLQ